MVQPKEYVGSQIPIIADRVLILAKKDMIFLNSKVSISLSTNKTINLDCNEHTIINSPKIYLGINSTKEDQPALRGNDIRNILSQLISSISKLIDIASKTPGDIPPALSLGLGLVKGTIDSIKETYGNDLNKALSTKTFVE